MILVDTREQRAWTETSAWTGVEVQRATLKTGDYSNGIILIERKSVNDFINCCGVRKKRFMREVERGFDYLIIEGTMDDLRADLKRCRSRMTIQYIAKVINDLRHTGIEVLLCKNREAAASLALELLEGSKNATEIN